MIDGVKIKKLKVIPDERGFLMEMLRRDDDLFAGFGQVYLSACYGGVVKGWHYHKKQTDNFVVVRGMGKVVLYDGRKDSPTHGEVAEFFMGEHNPILLQIPPFVMHGIKAMGGETCYLLNCPTEPYIYDDPDEYRLPHDTEEIPYNWDLKEG